MYHFLYKLYNQLISLAHISSFGVSKIRGILSNLLSCINSLNSVVPNSPLPKLSWRSICDPTPFLESLRCTALRYLNPIVSSNSRNVFSNPSAVAISYPPANVWHVSIHTPTRLLSSTRLIM